MTPKNSAFWLLGGVGLVLDRLTKAWAVANLQPQGELQLWPGVFHLTYATNSGAAWSLFAGSGGFLRWVSLVVCIGLVGLALFGKPLTRWEQVGYGSILAGAGGNGWDRFATGYVVDFLNACGVWVPGWNGSGISWSTFPVFNVADILINVGVGCLVMAALRTPPLSDPPSLPPPAAKS